MSAADLVYDSGSDSDSSGYDSELEALRMEQEAAMGTAQQGINDIDAINQKRADIKLNGGKPVEWIETMLLSSKKNLDDIDFADDLKRETAMYTLTLEAVKDGIERLSKIPNFKWRRPDGTRADDAPFLAEMVKTDTHMAKVKGRLMGEQKRIKESEEKRHARTQKKYGKQMQAEQHQERMKQKKSDMDKIKQWRKGHRDGLDAEDLVNSTMNGRPRPASTDKRPQKQGPNAKRKAKDARYGSGGKKRWAKSNTRDTTEDTKGFNPRKMKNDALGVHGGGIKKKQSFGKARPGKSKRANAHGRR
eukprot:TRINITY_DN59_c0_g1_i1.p1 TRINITY_DN59_c0_g1~~TRINITY_DN59_c0_g1_i1.p1  ORF type:complete len:304 (+),score=66.39 TRINITY_DN59_c0_g1_i1:27-938(+)